MGEKLPCTFHDAVKFTIIGMLYGGLIVFIALYGLGAFNERPNISPIVQQIDQ